jgi:hypothetical protein
MNNDIEALIAYNWEPEMESYIETFNLPEDVDPIAHAAANDNHIFCSIARLHLAQHKTEKPVLSPQVNKDV